jgi:hypothetical protein
VQAPILSMQARVVRVQVPIPSMQARVVRLQAPIPPMQARVVQVQASIPSMQVGVARMRVPIPQVQVRVVQVQVPIPSAQSPKLIFQEFPPESDGVRQLMEPAASPTNKSALAKTTTHILQKRFRRSTPRKASGFPATLLS